MRSDLPLRAIMRHECPKAKGWWRFTEDAIVCPCGKKFALHAAETEEERRWLSLR